MPDLPLHEAAAPTTSPFALSLLRQAGPNAYATLVIAGPTPADAHQALDRVKPAQLISQSIRQMDDAKAALAGMWLWFGALAESHSISQDLVSPTGSFWHAIMHRLEGDFSNAKYWYRRCDTHQVNRMMGSIASSLAGDLASDRQVAHALGGSWNPLGFVDLVQSVHNTPADPRHDLAVRLQRAEWIALFNHCVRQAVEPALDGLDRWDMRINNPAGG
jgi:hypothetical protein